MGVVYFYSARSITLKIFTVELSLAVKSLFTVVLQF